MAIIFFQKTQFYKVWLWNRLLLNIVINAVIDGFTGEDFKWLANVTDYRCPITANCPITRSDYNFAD